MFRRRHQGVWPDNSSPSATPPSQFHHALHTPNGVHRLVLSTTHDRNVPRHMRRTIQWYAALHKVTPKIRIAFVHHQPENLLKS